MFLSLFFSVCLSPKFCLEPLLGSEAACIGQAQSENRSNHLFIDWNIRGLRGSEGVGAKKSGKDRLAGGYWREKKMVVGISEMEKEKKKNVEWIKKVDSFALKITTDHNILIEESSSDGEETQTEGYFNYNTVRQWPIIINY